MSGSILPSRVSTTFTLVKTSVWADGSAFDCAEMHGFKQKKASTNTRIFQPREQAEKTVGEAYDRADSPVNQFQQPVFSERMREWHLCPVWTIPARSHPNPWECPFRVSRAEIQTAHGVRRQVSYQNSAVDLRRFE